MQKPLSMLVFSVLLAACSSSPPVAPALSAAEPMRPVLSGQAPVAAKPAASAATQPMRRPEQRSVYFPYDDFTVDASYEQLLGAHASYLTHNPSSRVSLEGNADERGSSEYNLALGQKRAEAVRKSLSLRGVPDRQMEPISYGKERPRATCHDESCWQINRRTDIVQSAGR